MTSDNFYPFFEIIFEIFYYKDEKKNIFSFFKTKNFLVHVNCSQFSKKSWKKFKKILDGIESKIFKKFG